MPKLRSSDEMPSDLTRLQETPLPPRPGSKAFFGAYNRQPSRGRKRGHHAMADVFKPGEEVPKSGIYRVVHDPNHAAEHEVTCIIGKPFPPCNRCGHHV